MSPSYSVQLSEVLPVLPALQVFVPLWWSCWLPVVHQDSSPPPVSPSVAAAARPAAPRPAYWSCGAGPTGSARGWAPPCRSRCVSSRQPRALCVGWRSESWRPPAGGWSPAAEGLCGRPSPAASSSGARLKTPQTLRKNWPQNNTSPSHF